ncbi:CPBP family intramembrane glutamic endopeptidase [Hymenobacter jeollabukensis]|uniref:CPBP family intramembrane metalloprotease n=1 Tax=Hymenobacter jeollabukensis TaxID=2025313 RepID=A0A5R8WWC2_9BACT|nr:type II CAAX endopeptidase family protein [Hymenobacter jeollabukensis]TLM96830.1 CPBP family intramembrane metalloprotease [Hymenobacter jeollabukensis]
MEPTYSEAEASPTELIEAAAAERAAVPPPAYPTYAESWGVLGWYLLTMLLTGIVAGGFLLWLPKSTRTGPTMLLGELAQLGLVFWLVAQAGGRAQPVRWRGRFDGPVLGAVVVLTTYGVALAVSALQWLRLPHWGVDAAFNQLMLNPALSFGLICVAAPVIEEWLFRGLLLPGLARNYGPTRAILQSSLLFGIIHFNPAQSLMAFCLGLFQGWLYTRTRSVRVCVLSHATVNTAAWAGMYFTRQPYGQATSWAQTSAGDLASIGAGALVAAAGIWYLHRLTAAGQPDALEVAASHWPAED